MGAAWPDDRARGAPSVEVHTLEVISEELEEVILRATGSRTGLVSSLIPRTRCILSLQSVNRDSTQAVI